MKRLKNFTRAVKPFVPHSVKASLIKGSFLFRRMTSPWRGLPDFIVIGSQKSGSSSLFYNLCRHPDIRPPMCKEVHYFDLNYDRGVNWYRAHFPVSFHLKLSGRGRIHKPLAGEATVYYLFHPLAAKRAFSCLPDLKLIVLLRNPVDRAYSHYQAKVRNGTETLSFEEAVKAEEERLRGEAERILSDETYQSFNHRNFSYLKKGIYIDQIKSWMRFFPRDRFLIIKSEDFFRNPQPVFENLLRFLGLQGPLPQLEKTYNRYPYREMASGMREYLTNYFAPHNRRLYEFLGEDFSWESRVNEYQRV